MPREAVTRLIEIAHQLDVPMSASGFIARVIAQEPELVECCAHERRDHSIDIIEISSGFIAIPSDDWLRLIEQVRRGG